MFVHTLQRSKASF